MDRIAKDKYVLFSAAVAVVLILVCTVGSFNTAATEGNGITEITGVVSDPSPSPNGTVFKVTDLDGSEYKCFSSSKLPETPSLCILTGSFSADGNIFFVDKITVSGDW